MPKRSIVALILSLLVSGCGGGGSSATPVAGGPARSGATQTAQFAFTIPHAQSALRPKVVSPNTATVVLSVLQVNGSTPVPPYPTLTVTIASSPFCQSSGGSVSCTIPFTVPIASAVTIQIATFDAQGHELNVGTLTLNTTQPITSTQSVTLGDFPTSATFGSSALGFANGGSSTAIQSNVTISIFNGTTLITNPVTYGGTVTLTPTNVPTGSVTVSPSTLTQPDGTTGASNTVSVSYTSSIGGTLPSNAALVVAYNGVTIGSLPLITLNYTPASVNNLYLGGPSGTISVNERNFAGTFSISGTNGKVTYTCVPSTCTPTSAGGSVQITLSPQAAGTTTLSVSDGTSTPASIPVSVAATSGGVTINAPKIYTYHSTDSTGQNYGMTVGPDGSIWFVDQPASSPGQLAAISNPAACNATTCAVSEGSLAQVTESNLRFITGAQTGQLFISDANIGSDNGAIVAQTCSATPVVNCSSGSASTPLTYTAASQLIVSNDGYVYVPINYTDTSQYGQIERLPISNPTAPTSFQASSSSSAPTTGIYGITLDSTGQYMWYTDTANGLIGRLSLPFCQFCTVTELPIDYSYGGGAGPIAGQSRPAYRRPFPVTGSFTGLAGIVSATDGNLYVAETGANRIDQLNSSTWQTCTSTLTCTITNLAMPSNVSSPMPLHLVQGSDGNVWFTDASGYIGEIVLSTCSSGCKVYEYHVGGSPFGIVAGPDGNVWFTDSSSNVFGKVVLQ